MALIDWGRGVNFQVTVLKVLVSYPDGFAVMEDLKRDMAILVTSGREWADRTTRLAARVPDLNIFSQGLVERISGGWRVTSKGREVLEFMETLPAASEPIRTPFVEQVADSDARCSFSAAAALRSGQATPRACSTSSRGTRTG